MAIPFLTNTSFSAAVTVASTGAFGDNVSIIKNSAVNLRVSDGTQNVYVGSSGNTRFGQAPGASIIQSTGAAFGIGTQDGNNFFLGTNNTAVITMNTSSLTTFSGDIVVQGTGNSSFSGNVGIGTSVPTDKLDIAGAAKFITNISFDVNKPGRIYKASNHGLAIHSVTGSQNDFAMFTPNGQLRIVVPTGTGNVILNPSSGNVGIGITGPTAPLHFGKSVYGAPSSENFFRVKFFDNGGIMNDVGIGQPNSSSIGWNITPSVNGVFEWNSGTRGRIMNLDYLGKLTLDDYDGTNQTGTPTYILGTDSSGNVVKVLGGNIPGGGGTVTGTGTTNRLTKFTDGPNGVIGNSGIQDASNAIAITINGNEEVGIGSVNPTAGKLVVSSSANQLALETGTAGDGRLHVGHFSNGAFIGTYGDDGGVADLIRFGTHSGDERMRIASNGNVGIGTTIPAVRLDFGSSTGKAFHLYTSALDYYGFNMQVYDAGPFSTNIISGNGGEIKLRTASGSTTQVTRLTVASGGNVGIGTTSPTAAKLVIIGNGSNPALEVRNTSTGDGIKIFTANSTANNGLLWFQGTSNLVNFYSSSSNFGILEMNNVNTNTVKINSGGSSFFNGGNVGIGTTGPNTALQVNQATTVPLLIHRPSNTNFDPHGIGFSTRNDAANGGLGDVRSGIFSDYNGDLFLAASQSSITSNPLASSRLFIEGSNGNVGIGTTSPINKLQIAGTVQTDNQGRFKGWYTTGDGLGLETGISAGDGYVLTYNRTSGVYGTTIIESTGINFQVTTASTFLFNGGNVGIGTTSPAFKLDVAGGTKSTFYTSDGSRGFRQTGTAFVSTYSNGSSGDAANDIGATSDRWRNGFFSGTVTAANFVGGSGAFLPLSAGSGFPLTGDLYINSGKQLRLYRSDNASYARFDYSGSSVGLDIDDLNGDGINLQQAGVNKLRIETSGNATFAGNVTITTANTDTTLTLGTTASGGVNWKLHSASSSSPYAASAGDFLIRNASSTVLNLQNNGNVRIQDNKAFIWGNTNQQIIGNNSVGLLVYSNGERMRINLLGNLLIGQTANYTPTGASATARTVITLSQNEKTSLVVSNQNNGLNAYAQLVLATYGHDFSIRMASLAAGSALQFIYASAERMRISSTGNVGINTTGPSAKLSIVGSGGNGGILFNNPSSQEHRIYSTSNTQFNLIGSSAPIWVFGQSDVSNNLSGTAALNLSKTSAAFSGNITAPSAAFTGKATSASTVSADAATTLVTKDYVDSSAGNPSHFRQGFKTLTVGTTFISALTVSLAAHDGCYVTLCCFGDWGSHSTAAYRGEFFLQNGGGVFNEPGIILRQDDNTSDAGDQIICQIVDPPGSTGNRDFVIQIRHTDTTSPASFSGTITFTVQGKFNSVT